MAELKIEDVRAALAEQRANEGQVHAPKNSAGSYDQLGRFLPDATVIDPPIGYSKSKSIAEQIRDMVRSEALRQAADAAGAETFDEADDFDIGDDLDPASPYEETFDPTPVSELRRRAAEAAQAEASNMGDDGTPIAPSPLEPLKTPGRASAERRAKPDPKRPAQTDIEDV